MRQDQNAHLVAYSYLQLLLHLGVRRCQVHALVECTYCGGPHPRSQCRWPLGGRQSTGGQQ